MPAFVLSRYLSFFHRTLQGRLALLVAAVLLPVTVLVVWLIYESYQNERRQLERHLIAAVRATSLLVDSEVGERESLLWGLATSSRLQRGEFSTFRAQAQAAVQRSDEWILLVDIDGTQRMNTLLPPDAVLPNFRYEPEFLQTLREGRTYVSNLVFDENGKASLLFTAVPIRIDGEVRYALISGMRPAAFRNALGRGGVAPSWNVSIVDRTGVIAARTRNPEQYVGAKAGPIIAAAMAASRERVIESTTLDGIKGITAFARSARTGWTIVVSAPGDELYASARRLLSIALSISLLLGATGALLAVWFARGVVSAVQTIVEQTLGIGRGEPVRTESTGIAETDLVLRALGETSGQLARREAELKELNESLRKAGRAKDEFLAALSHELRTPLNPVLLIASEGAQCGDYPVAARDAFSAIAKNVLLEARLIDDLLDLTRITEGKLLLEKQTVDVHRVLAEALATVRPELEAKAQQLEVRLAPGAAPVHGDPTRLQQVLWNVLKNAVKFTPKHGRILVTSAMADGRVRIEIADEGIGLTPDEIGRVFKIFSQGDHATGRAGHRFGGLGLGLAISRMLMELHDGRISARSPGRDQGAVFAMELPLSATPALLAADVEPVEETAADAPGPQGLRILLVEDHEATRLTLVRLLQRRKLDVSPAADAAEALRLASERSFDVVFSDIGLPDLDGFSLMRHLRERHGLRGVALTGYGTEADIDRGRAAGFIAHLTKPIEVRKLEAVLRNLSAPDS